jgi:hypothetical protein
MTTAYDRLVQKWCCLLSLSVVDTVVVQPLLAMVHPPLFGMKGCFQCHHQVHMLRNETTVTESNITPLINLHTTHIIWSLSASGVNKAKYTPPININFHYITQLCFL